MIDGIPDNNSIIEFKTIDNLLGAIFEIKRAVNIDIGQAIKRASAVTIMVLMIM